MKTTILTSAAIPSDIAPLFARYRDFVLRLCMRYVKNQPEAEDLTQEIFLKAAAAWQGFAGQSQPSTWLYRIAANHCLDHLRWKKRQRDLLDAYAAGTDTECAEEEEGLPVMRDILDRLREEMDALDSHIVYLRFELGFTHQAIAEICGVSRVAITKRLGKIETRAKQLHAEAMRPEIRMVA
jgi:RNA polymerase sigma-70 factor (ECF subfamily)